MEIGPGRGERRGAGAARRGASGVAGSADGAGDHQPGLPQEPALLLGPVFDMDPRNPAQGTPCSTAPAKSLATLKGHTNSIITLAFSPDGRSLAITGAESWNDNYDKTNGVVKIVPVN